jgi:hypothetical protein
MVGDGAEVSATNHRGNIEGRSPQMIADNLKMAFDHFC